MEPWSGSDVRFWFLIWWLILIKYSKPTLFKCFLLLIRLTQFTCPSLSCTLKLLWEIRFLPRLFTPTRIDPILIIMFPWSPWCLTSVTVSVLMMMPMPRCLTPIFSLLCNWSTFLDCLTRSEFLHSLPTSEPLEEGVVVFVNCKLGRFDLIRVLLWGISSLSKLPTWEVECERRRLMSLSDLNIEVDWADIRWQRWENQLWCI